jgi:uncharacterized protein (TIGR02328 family)
MRCWHKDLISVLPKQQLVAQWRECCLIAKNIAEKGTPNHILVNRIMDYPIDHFIYYANLVEKEMKHRGYKCDYSVFEKYGLVPSSNGTIKCDYSELFKDWHNERYYIQCFYNLQEKYDAGGISEDEWNKLIREKIVTGTIVKDRFPAIIGADIEIYFNDKWIRGKVVNGYRFDDGIVTMETPQGKQIWCGVERTDLYRKPLN